LKRTLVISDIHGELNKFLSLLEKVNYNSESDQLILLGDYIDRGPASSSVLDKVIELKQQGALVLKGNHEDMMARAFSVSNNILHWVRNGGRETLISYGYTIENENDIESLVTRLTPLTPTEKVKEHLEFIESLDYYVEMDDIIFVHGGVHPTTALVDTDPHVLIWIRDEFHRGYKGEKTVVFGHTPTQHFHEGHDIYFGENRIIGIDGGCVYGGQLNCLELPSHNCHFVK
jgi:serine/threonine protein phosphatase 1